MKLKCNECGIEKPLTTEFFKKGKAYKTGFRPCCKECIRLYQKEYRQTRDESLKEKRREHYKSIPDKVQAWHKASKANHKARMQKDPIYAARYRKHELDRRARRFENEPSYKLGHYLRSRIRSVIKKNKKAGSAVKDLGCSLEELKLHLESLFQPGMSWDNHGEWHIDHIRPLSSFDLTNREDFIQACHYTNLQPLWALDNIKKSDKT